MFKFRHKTHINDVFDGSDWQGRPASENATIDGKKAHRTSH